jgi:hypothetical protein
MARKGRTPLHNSSLPGMPGKRSLRRQALQIARSSVTPKSEITHQYNRAQTDTTGFTQALIGLLQGQQGAYTSAANDALTQQQGIDTAAVSRLNGLGASIAPAAQVATGALGDTAASRLVGQGEALKAYGAQQPGIAASRGALAHLGLTNAEQDALQQRRDQLHQAYMQAYPQVQQNAFNQSLAIQNLGLSRQQLAAQIAQNKAGLAQQGASLAEQQREFGITAAEQRREFNITARQASQKASAAGFTPNEVQSFRSDIYDAISTAKKGIPLVGGKGHQLVHGDTGKPRWKVPPAPLGAPKEPGQENSIFALYKFLSSRYDPALQPLILAELKAAYPVSTWNLFKRAMTGGSGGGRTPSQKKNRHR